MPNWLPSILHRLQDLASRGRVRFTVKALEEIEELSSELSIEEVYFVLANLQQDDFVERFVSEKTDEWMYVFKPLVEDEVIYVKVILRTDCVLISFHEDEDHADR